MQASWRINDLVKKVNSINNGSSEMKLGLLDGSDDGEHRTLEFHSAYWSQEYWAEEWKFEVAVH